VAAVTFRDETPTGQAMAAFTLPGLPETMTARELLRLRVREEVAKYNTAPSARFRGLVRPDGAEAGPDGYHLRTPRPLDWERQADAAERAFARNGFFMLAGDRQVDDLDDVVSLTAHPDIVFVKLIPLAGG
jgi:hypothetical protein